MKNTVDFKHSLGDKVRDIVTNFEGIIISRLQYLNGCIQYGIKPPVKPGDVAKMPDAVYLDENQLIFLESTDVSNIVQIETGGPQLDQPKG